MEENICKIPDKELVTRIIKSSQNSIIIPTSMAKIKKSDSTMYW